MSDKRTQFTLLYLGLAVVSIVFLVIVNSTTGTWVTYYGWCYYPPVFEIPCVTNSVHIPIPILVNPLVQFGEWVWIGGVLFVYYYSLREKESVLTR